MAYQTRDTVVRRVECLHFLVLKSCDGAFGIDPNVSFTLFTKISSSQVSLAISNVGNAGGKTSGDRFEYTHLCVSALSVGATNDMCALIRARLYPFCWQNRKSTDAKTNRQTSSVKLL
jgi:hypothetical protein